MELLALIISIRLARASPFELTEKYVSEFQQGIDKLIRESREYKPIEQSLDHSKLDEESALKEAETFDFVVVGAGSAGAALAARLSEVPEWKILLLEAGAPETAVTLIPSLAGAVRATSYSWGYNAEPQETVCLGNEEN